MRIRDLNPTLNIDVPTSFSYATLCKQVDDLRVLLGGDIYSAVRKILDQWSS